MTAPSSNAAAGSENILVRGVNWLGDSVMTVPALERLREARPNARITLLAPEKLGGLWEGQPFLDETILFSPTDTIWRTSNLLRGKKFARALAFPNSLRSALELWLAGIPQRIGYERPGRTLFLTTTVPPPPGAWPMHKRSPGEVRQLLAGAERPPPVPPTAHHIHNYLHLAAALGASAEPKAPRLTLSQEELEKTAARLGLTPGQDHPFLGMNPGAEYGPAKRWPAEAFIAAGRAIHRTTGCRWIIFGGPADLELARVIATGLGKSLPDQPVINLAGRTTLRQLAAALKCCRVLLTNDSGPMHLAAALGTPVVALFGSTSPQLTGPLWSGGAQILTAPGIPCAPCFRRTCPIDSRCLTAIAPAAVEEAVWRALIFKPEPNHP